MYNIYRNNRKRSTIVYSLSTIKKIKEAVNWKSQNPMIQKDSVAVDHSFASYLQYDVKRNVTFSYNYVIVQFLDIHFAREACEKKHGNLPS